MNTKETAAIPASSKLMTHSTSVNALSKNPHQQPSLMQYELLQRPAPLLNQYSRYSPHGQQVQQSHSTSNLNSMATGTKLSFGSGSRSGATSGVKLTPSTQVGSWTGAQRTDSSPMGAGGAQNGSNTNGSGILLSHPSFNQQSKSRQSVKIGGGNPPSNSGGQSHSKGSGSGSLSGAQQSNMLHTISHKERHNHGGGGSKGSSQQPGHGLKVTKSFSTSGEQASLKPPQSNSTKVSSQQIAASAAHANSISGKIIHHQGSSHQASSSSVKHGSSSEHQNLQHMRTQASLGLKHHLSANIIGVNTRQSSSHHHGGHESKTNNSMNLKRASETIDLERHNFGKVTGGSFVKQNRLSHQVGSSSQSTGQNRLVAHKTSLNDFKKPVSLTQNPISSQSVKNHQAVSSSTPTSQIVSAHTYQPSSINPNAHSTTLNSMHSKSSNYSQIQTPTTAAMKSHKPPIGNESAKHNHSNSLHGTTKAPSSSSQAKRTSPRSTLNVFTKNKASVDSTKSGTLNKHNSFSTSSQQHLNTFSPKDDNSGKRRGDAKSQVFPHNSNTANKNYPQSIKAQVTQNHGKSSQGQQLGSDKGSKMSSSLHHQASSGHGGNQVKPRSSLAKNSSISGNQKSEQVLKEQDFASRGPLTKKHSQQYSQTTKNAISFNGRSSSAQMGTNNLSSSGIPQSEKSGRAANEIENNDMHTKGQQQLQSSQATLDRFKDKHPKLHHHESAEGLGNQQQAKNSIPILNAYKQRSSSPPDPVTSKATNNNNTTGSLQRYGGTQHTKSSLTTQMSQKLAINKAPPQMSTASNSIGTPSSDKPGQLQNQGQVQASSINHQHKMSGGVQGNGTSNNSSQFQRKVRSATRATDINQPVSHKDGGVANTAGGLSQPHLGHHNQHKLPQQKITDRPSSASAGQKFIGRQQNLKELFERNWQSVNVQHKVDPHSGEATQIRTLTVVDTNKMVHEDQEQAAALQLAPGTRIIIPNHEPTKCSNKRNGIVRAYAANTNQGLVRNYNEDRVSIILNIVKPEHRKHETWPTCSFFGVYDGHGGSACAEFLRDNLHHYVIKEESFPWEPEDAIRAGFEKAESRFIEMCQAKDESTGQLTVIERSGSCAIVVLIVGEICYVANVGDSRAVLSSQGGQQVTALSRDHKPSDVEEYKRIIQAGGQIYQTTTSQILNQKEMASQQQNGKSDPEFIVGPIRVLPGRLSVCRTFGDPEAKLEYRGGNPNVVKATPDIRKFQISKNHDFIVLASDGIFDKLTDDDIDKAVWLTCDAARLAKSTLSAGQNLPPQGKQVENNISVHQYTGLGVEGILKNSLMRQSLDNVTVVMVAFQNFKRIVCGQPSSIPQSSEKQTDAPVSQRHQSSAQKQSEAAATANNNSLEQENLNYMSNGKKKAAVRSQQTLSNVHGLGDRDDLTHSKQLTRQTGDQSVPRQGKHSSTELVGPAAGSRLHGGHGLARTRSQNHDHLHQHHHQQPTGATNADQDHGQSRQSAMQQAQSHLSKESSYSIRQQQQQHQSSKMSSQYGGASGQQQNSSSFTKGRHSSDAQGGQHRQLQNNNNNYLDGAGNNSRQQAKPPMASANIQSSKQTRQVPDMTQQQQRDNGGGAAGGSTTTNSGVRSLSLKEVQQKQSGQNNFHGRLNQLANLNSNKSLSGLSSQHQHQQHTGTPTTQSSNKSGSITMQHPHLISGGSNSGSQSQISTQQQAVHHKPHVNSHKPSPSHINQHHRHSQQSNQGANSGQPTSALIFGSTKA